MNLENDVQQSQTDVMFGYLHIFDHKEYFKLLNIPVYKKQVIKKQEEPFKSGWRDMVH